MFIISIRKDVDKGFSFPSPTPLELRLKDVLEDEVDEKYYLSDDTVDKLVLKHTDGAVKEIGYIRKSDTGTKHQSNTVYDSNSLGKTLTACDYKNPLMIKEDTKTCYKETYLGDSISCNYLNSEIRRRQVDKDGVADTITCQADQAVIGPIRLGGIFDDEKSRHQAGGIWDKNSISPTIDTMQGGYRQPLILDNKDE